MLHRFYYLMLLKHFFIKGGGSGVQKSAFGRISDYIFPGSRDQEFVHWYFKACIPLTVNESFILFSFIYNALKNSDRLFLQVYDAQMYSRSLKIEHISNSIASSNNLLCSFQDEVKIVNNRHTSITVSKNTCSIYGHMYHQTPAPTPSFK